MLFQENGKSVKFHIKDVSEEEFHELTELVEKNGGEINNGCADFIFTSPKTNTEGKTAFDVKYIYDCIRDGRILNLDDYILGRTKLRSCMTMLFITGKEHFNCPTYANLNLCESEVLTKKNINTNVRNEHSYTARDSTIGNESRILSTEEAGDTPFSNPIYYPDEMERQWFFELDENIALVQEIGDTQALDTIYNSDDTQLQSIDEKMSNEPDERFSFEIKQTSETATSSDLNVETNKDVCFIREEPSVRMDTETIIELSSSPETVFAYIPRESAEYIETARKIGKSQRDPSPTLRASYVASFSGTPEYQSPSRSAEGKLRKGLQLENANIQTAASKVGDTPWLLHDITNRFRSTNESTHQSPRVTGNSSTSSNRQVMPDQLKTENENIQTSSSDVDSQPKSRNWKIFDLPGCSGQSTSTSKNSQPKTKLHLYSATRNFMLCEEEQMVKYLIQKKWISRAKGNVVWREMIAEGLTHRSFQSLHNHFRKYILPNIHRFTMTARNRAEFNKLRSH